MSTIFASKRILYLGILLSIVFSVPFLGLGGGSAGCNASFNLACAKHINFDSVTSKSSVLGALNQTLTVTATSGDLLTVATGNYIAQTGGTNLIVVTTSVTDNFGDNFTRQVRSVGIDVGDQINVDDEIWTGFIIQPTVIITIKSNSTAGLGGGTTQLLDNIGAYRNVLQVGSNNSTVWSLGFSQPILNVTITGSSSWIVGSSVVNDVPPTILPGANLIQRSIVTGSGGNAGDLQDTNSSIVPTNSKFSYIPSFGGACCTVAQVAVEISPTFIDQSNECTTATASICTAANVCTTTNGLCVTSQYKLNYVSKATGINTAQNIVVGTSYCTGITTSALTISGIHPMQLWAEYNGQSRNDTGAILEVQAYITSVVPTTVFSSGLCAGSSTIVGSGKIYFATSGSTLTAFGLNEYQSAVNGVATNLAAATYYGYLEITPQSVGAGNLGSTIQFAQWAAIGHSTIAVLEIK